jgi:hypothetical protein
MNCRHAQWLVSDALNAGETLPENVSRHVKSCPRCGAFLEAAERAATTLKVAAVTTDTGSVAARVLQQVASRDMRTAASRPFLRYGWAAAAAVALAVLGLRALHEPDRPPAVAAIPATSSAMMAGADLLGESLSSPLEEEALNLAEDVRDLKSFLAACVSPAG